MSNQKTSPRRMAREPSGDTMSLADNVKRSEPKAQSKSTMLLELLGRDGGATLDQMVEAAGWLPHTTRAALTGFRKKGHAVTSEKVDWVRTYRLAQVAV